MEQISRILVVEDETIIAGFIKHCLSKKGFTLELLYSADGEFEMLLIDFAPDLVLIDINLNSEKTGIDLAGHCAQMNIPFIYVISYSDSKTLTEAMVHDPSACLLKPFSEKDLTITLAMAKAKLSRSNSKKALILKEGFDMVRIDVSTIKWVKADNNYIQVVTREKKYLQRTSLQAVLGLLPEDSFIRVHRSYVVNINAVTRVSSDSVLLGDDKIPIGRTKKAELVSKLTGK